MEPENTNPQQTAFQQPAPQQATNDAFIDPTQRRPGFSFSNLLKNKLAVLSFILIVVLLVAGLLYYFASRQDTSKAAQELQDAQEAYQKGDLKTAQEKLLAAYKISPKDPKTQAALIKAIAVDGNLTGKEDEAFKKAEPYVKEALTTNGDDVDVLLAVGYVYEIDGKYEEALEFYEKALSKDPGSAEGLFHKGHVLEFLGRQQEAFDSYTKAYQVDKENPQIVTSYAKFTLSQGKTTEAFNLYKQAAALPNISVIDKADALINASILRRVSLLTAPEAIELSREAVDIAPNYAPALATHGFNIGIYDKDLPNGIIYLRRAIEANPRISQNYGRLAALYRLADNYPEAISLDEKALSLIDNDNTIFTQKEKNDAKGAMMFDLAISQYHTDPNANVLELLENSMQLAPGLKPTLKRYYEEFGYFKNLESEPSFLSLIQ